MRNLILALAALGLFAGRGFAQTVLVLAASDAAERHGALLEEWRQQVVSEGWSVLLETVPRTGSGDPERAERVVEIIRRTEQVKPRALFLFGAVARPATGFGNPDGHAPRCIWNDFPYSGSISSLGWSDRTNFPTSYTLKVYQNAPGDGRWDQNWAINGARWAVGRVDFSGLPQLPRGLVPQGKYGEGEPTVPAIDEHAALEDYLRRDLAWRRGAWRPDLVAYVYSALWTEEKGGLLRSHRPEVSWTPTDRFIGSPGAGRQLFAYASYGQDYRYSYHLADPVLGPIRGVWFANYRSYEYEQIWEGGGQQGDQGNRRWLTRFLLVTWGPMDPLWMKGRTAADGYLAFLGTRRYRTFHHQLDGDPTLPLQQPEAPPSPGSPRNLRVLSALSR